MWAAAVAISLAGAPALAEGYTLVLDPAETEVTFVVDATLNSVKGRFGIVEGSLRFDADGGPAAGRVVVDARSARTGNRLRDDHMHDDVLVSVRYPRIVLSADSLEVRARSGDRLTGLLHGSIEILGDAHPVAIDFEAEREPDGRGHVEGAFEVPYVAWGLTDVSNFVLRVGKTTTIRFEGRGTLRPEPAPEG